MKDFTKHLKRSRTGLARHFPYKSAAKMTGDEFGRVIDGNMHARATDLSTQQLEAIIARIKP